MGRLKDLKKNPKHMTSIGGQALIEGVMMKGPDEIAIAVRKPDGEIELKKDKVSSKITESKILRLPFIRGSIALFEAMVIGTKALMYSAQFYEDDEEYEESKIDKMIENVFKDKAEEAVIYFSVILSMFFSVFLFMLAPSFVTNLMKDMINSVVVLNLIEGAIRLMIFFTYIVLVSRLKDIKRTFQYHGAEHKSIHCYEDKKELTVENVKKYTTLHPRCGTSFLFMVMMVSIVVFSVFGWPNPIMRVITRIVMLPVIAGISYEINKMIGKSNSKLAYALSYPGLMLQKITTNEPDDSQIEVAIEALKGVIVEREGADNW